MGAEGTLDEGEDKFEAEPSSAKAADKEFTPWPSPSSEEAAAAAEGEGGGSGRVRSVVGMGLARLSSLFGAGITREPSFKGGPPKPPEEGEK